MVLCFDVIFCDWQLPVYSVKAHKYFGFLPAIKRTESHCSCMILISFDLFYHFISTWYLRDTSCFVDTNAIGWNRRDIRSGIDCGRHFPDLSDHRILCDQLQTSSSFQVENLINQYWNKINYVNAFNLKLL